MKESTFTANDSRAAEETSVPEFVASPQDDFTYSYLVHRITSYYRTSKRVAN